MAGALTLTRPTNHAALVAVVLLRLKKNGPSGPIFRREPGLQRGRRRAPFARSREGSAHIKRTSWRMERLHLPYRLPLPGPFPESTDRETCRRVRSRLPAPRLNGLVFCRVGKAKPHPPFSPSRTPFPINCGSKSPAPARAYRAYAASCSRFPARPSPLHSRRAR